MKKTNLIKIGIIFLIVALVIPINSIHSEESRTVEVEVKYTNGDRADSYGMSLIVYQDNDKTPIIKKVMAGNPDSISLSNDHQYKIEVYSNGIYADVGYIEKNSTQKKIIINIPLSGGLQFNVFYKDNETPVNGATVTIKSQDGTQVRQGKTNDQGDTMRYWIQSTTKNTDYYLADVYLGDIHLTTSTQIKLTPGIPKDQKIIVPIPAIVEDLITVSLYKTEFAKITKDDGNYSILVKDSMGNILTETKVNTRGDAFFSNVPSKEYLLSVLKNGIIDNSWEEKKVVITGKDSMFKLIKIEPKPVVPVPIENTDIKNIEVMSCNCIAFRFDDVQDYWLNDVQIAYINTFVEKNIPLTTAIIADSFGHDKKITDVVKDAASKNKLKIASHGMAHEPFTKFSKQEQDNMLKQSISEIQNNVGVRPEIFVPPENMYNDDTEQMLVENKLTYLSSSTLKGESGPFPLQGQKLYKFPETATTGEYSEEQNLFVGRSHEDTYSNAKYSLKKYGFAVITSHPQEFAIIKNGTYSNQINNEQINELKLLIQKIQSDGIKIVSIDKINLDSSDITIPVWIKNNAGWWADGSIDDNSFVQGIQFLTNEGILKISHTQSTSSENNEIPKWIKYNAGWWADGQITDSEFIKGIEYLVNQNIIVS